MVEPLDRAVVEVDLADAPARGGRDVFGVHLEAVVLRRDVDLAGAQILDRLVAAAVAVVQPAGPRADAERQELMPEADAHEGDARVHDPPHRPRRRLDILRVAGAGRGRHAVRGERGDLVVAGVPRHHRHLQPAPLQRADDVALVAAVEDHDVPPRRVAGRRDRRDRGLRHDVALGGQRRAAGARDQLRVAQAAAIRHEHPAQQALVAQVPRQRPRVHLHDAGDAVPLQVGVEGAVRAPVARLVAVLAHDHPGDPRLPGLVVARRHPVVADQRVGEGDDLPVERGVGRDLLIPGHARREDDLAARLMYRPERLPPEEPPIFQCQHRVPVHHYLPLLVG